MNLIHEAGKFDGILQCCKRCGEVLFTMKGKGYKAPERVHKVANSTTPSVQVTNKGFKKGTFVKIMPHKTETTAQQPTCQNLNT